MNRSKNTSRRRFSLRALFIFTAILAVLINIAMAEIKRRILIAEIRSAGGKVEFADEIPWTLFESERVRRVDLPSTALHYDIRGSRLRRFENLEELWFIQQWEDEYPLPEKYSSGQPRPIREEYDVQINEDLWARIDSVFQQEDPYR